MSGILKHVSVGSDGTVWCVNNNNEIFMRDGNGWTRIFGSLSQISVGSASEICGVTMR